MNVKPKLSGFANAKRTLLDLRAKLKYRPPFTMFELSQREGLEVESLANMPARFDAWLDPHECPRFIAVNPNRPRHDQLFAIAREIGFCAQQRGFNSFILNRPWKWDVFAAAPDKLKQKISLIDAEHRAHWLMAWYATGDEFRAYVKAHPKKVVAMLYTDVVAGFYLHTLRVLTLWRTLFCALAIRSI